MEELSRQLVKEKQHNRRDKLTVAHLQREVARQKSEGPLVSALFSILGSSSWGREVVSWWILLAARTAGIECSACRWCCIAIAASDCWVHWTMGEPSWFAPQFNLSRFRRGGGASIFCLGLISQSVYRLFVNSVGGLFCCTEKMSGCSLPPPILFSKETVGISFWPGKPNSSVCSICRGGEENEG